MLIRRSAGLGVESTAILLAHLQRAGFKFGIPVLGEVHLQRTTPRLLYQHTDGVGPEAPLVPWGLRAAR